jgi:hypothetical protein
MPKREKEKFALLLKELESQGPFRANWNRYSPLGENKYHCHLGYHWACCWKVTDGEMEIEVYYAGSRESAPY